MFNKERFNRFANWLADTENVDYAQDLPIKYLQAIERDWKGSFLRKELLKFGY